MTKIEGIAYKLAKACISSKIYPSGMSESDALEILSCGFESVLHAAYSVRNVQFTSPLPGDIGLQYQEARIV